MKQQSRALRQNQTDAEKAIWRLLCDRQMHGLKFRRQHVINNCILDFYCYAAKLAVELDGGQHSELAHWHMMLNVRQCLPSKVFVC
jgi:adenine-specific DNA-methyltransferase